MPADSKDINSDTLPKAYDPKQVEKKWYQFWTKNGYFKACF